MVTVGVRNLKDQLSQYLELVKNGERVLVTEHNHPVAEIITPQKEIIENDSPEQKLFRRLAANGRATLADRTVSIAKSTDFVFTDGSSPDEYNSLTILGEIRADRI